jgi:hypothetical protein
MGIEQVAGIELGFREIAFGKITFLQVSIIENGFL